MRNNSIPTRDPAPANAGSVIAKSIVETFGISVFEDGEGNATPSLNSLVSIELLMISYCYGPETARAMTEQRTWVRGFL